MKRALAGAVCGVLLITTAACGGSPEAATTGSSGSPLAEYLGDGGGLSATEGRVSLQGDDPEKQQQVQELVAACMKEAGFEYLPYVPTAPEPQPVLEGDLDWARTYGYGISTIDMAAPDPSDDPNTAITDGDERVGTGRLPAGTVRLVVPIQRDRSAGRWPPHPRSRIAPHRTAAPTAVPRRPTGDADSAPGCVPQASAQVYGEPDVVDMQEFDTLFEALGKLQTSVRGGPEGRPAGGRLVGLHGRRRPSRFQQGRGRPQLDHVPVGRPERLGVHAGRGGRRVGLGRRRPTRSPSPTRRRSPKSGPTRSPWPSSIWAAGRTIRRCTSRSGPNSSRSSSTSTAANWSATGTRRAAGTDAVPPPADRHHVGLCVARRGGRVHRGVVRALPRRVGGPQHAAAGRSDLRSGDPDGAAVEGGHPRRRQLFRSGADHHSGRLRAPRC